MKIIAIGGGEMGRPKEEGGFYPIETLPIDKEIVRLSGKQKPRLLFLPTASKDSHSYYDVVKGYFGTRLGCQTDVLYLIDEKERSSRDEIKSKIARSDIIYVGGGDTMKMLETWKEYGIDKLLVEAGLQGKVLSGVSAGAICWFRDFNSDAHITEGISTEYVKLAGLGLIDLMVCPHYGFEPGRKESLVKQVRQNGFPALALCNCSALEYVDGRARILTSSPKAEAYLVYKQGRKVIERALPKDEKFRSMKDLTSVPSK